MTTNEKPKVSRVWVKPALTRLGKIADIAATGPGPNQCGGGGGCTPKS